jgi:hypothetical protein
LTVAMAVAVAADAATKRRRVIFPFMANPPWRMA